MIINKVYTTTPTLCKNGVTKPITRVHLETPCDICEQPMIIEKYFRMAVKKNECVRWRCTDKNCNHSKMTHVVGSVSSYMLNKLK